MKSAPALTCGLMWRHNGVRQSEGLRPAFSNCPGCLCPVDRPQRCPREPKGGGKLVESVNGKLTRKIVATGNVP